MTRLVDNDKPTFLDFFAGSGLVTEALKNYFEPVWANDISDKKRAVYIANHKPDNFVLRPIELIKGKELPEATLSWGSFPCQDISLAGKLKGISSERSGLVWEWLRVMDEMGNRPAIAVAENVGGLVSAVGGGYYRELHDAFVKRGYKAGAILLDAVNWLPQSRKRVFVVIVDERVNTKGYECGGPIWCHTKSIVRAAAFLKNWVWWYIPEPVNQKRELDDIIDFEAPFKNEVEAEKIIRLIPYKHLSRLKEEIKKGKRVFPGYRRIRKGRQVLELRFDGVAGCLRTPQGGSSRQYLVIADRGELKVRLLTIPETAALMGAPGTYKIPGSYNDAYRAMGDAVAVPVARYLAEKLLIPLHHQ